MATTIPARSPVASAHVEHVPDRHLDRDVLVADRLIQQVADVWHPDTVECSIGRDPYVRAGLLKKRADCMFLNGFHCTRITELTQHPNQWKALIGVIGAAQHSHQSTNRSPNLRLPRSDRRAALDESMHVIIFVS